MLSHLSVTDDQDTKTDSVASPAKKQEPVLLHQEVKQENVSGKKKVSAKKQKGDNGENTEGFLSVQTHLTVKSFFCLYFWERNCRRISFFNSKRQEFQVGKILMDSSLSYEPLVPMNVE